MSSQGLWQYPITNIFSQWEAVIWLIKASHWLIIFVRAYCHNPSHYTWCQSAEISISIFQHGEVSCRPLPCPVVTCKNPVYTSGECCPICLSEYNIEYLQNKQFQITNVTNHKTILMYIIKLWKTREMERVKVLLLPSSLVLSFI